MGSAPPAAAGLADSFLLLVVAAGFAAVLLAAGFGGAAGVCARLAAPHESAPATIRGVSSRRKNMMRSGSPIIVTGRWPHIGRSHDESHSRETLIWEGAGRSRLTPSRAPHAAAPTAPRSIARDPPRRMYANARRHPG